ncbi:MAG: large subunit ribosomal protein [Chloroflexota bacterium]|jgi:large subunit ribosomal protein L17|nr:large subunit ribosomal protein [Chloroflexota bacterium]
MRHNKSGRKFGRTASHRQAMTRNQITSLLRSGRIETTEAKAKELRRWVERVISTARADDLAARREVMRHITDPEVTDRLFTNLMPRLKERPGGYTRIIPKGPRHGDAAPMVLIELVD